tara:strand:- start:13301 stop:14443 length:1143 start_codon:yes stop_codon:yes gene_type:complete
MVFITYIIGTLPLIQVNGSASSRTDENQLVGARKIIVFSLILSILGLAFLIFDKAFIQGIDYSQGLAYARENWRQQGEAREGAISSLFSVLGYVLSGALFLALALLPTKHVAISDFRRFLYFLIGATCLVISSVITGGRSSILLALAIMSFGYFSSKERGSALFGKARYRWVIYTTGLILFVYTVYIFYTRAQSTGISPAEYGISFLYYLGLKPAAWFEAYSHTSNLGGVASILNLALAYLTHSIATTAGVIQYSGEQGVVLFNYIVLIFSKLGLTPPPPDWFLSGRFISVPGGLYFQFGVLGVCVGAIALGLASGFLIALSFRKRQSIFLFFLASLLETILLLSPFLLAVDFLYFPILLLSGLIVIFFLSPLKSINNAK